MKKTASKTVIIAGIATIVLCAFLTAIFIAAKMTRSALAPVAHTYFYKPATIDLLPESVPVPAGGNTYYKIIVPADAIHARLDGEFTVEPRPKAQVDMLLVTEGGMQHWKDLVSSTSLERNSSTGELIYHTGNTYADLFHLTLAPGTYYVIFYDEPKGDSSGYYREQLGTDRLIRSVEPRVTLSYERPNPGIPLNMRTLQLEYNYR